MLTGALERRASPENPSTNLSNPAPWLWEGLGGSMDTVSGVSVNAKTALGSSPFWSAVKIITEDVATLPLITYQRLQPRGKERARDHPNFQLLRNQPNPDMNAVTFWEMFVGHVILWGGGFAEKELDGAGRTVALWPLAPDKTRVVRLNSRKFVVTRLPNGQEVRLPAENVFHVPGFGFDGLNGVSVVTFHRRTLGLGLAMKEFGERFYGQGTTMSGLLTTDTVLKDKEQRDRLTDSMRLMHEGLGKSHRFALLEGGLKWQQMGTSPRDSQFIEGRKFDVLEVARLFRMPPHKLGDLDRAIQANVEGMQQSYYVDTLRPWLTRIEAAINTQLFIESERAEFFAEFLPDAILRGDIKTRFEAYRTGIQNGFLSPNDARDRENMNAFEGGDRHFIQLNMVPVELAGAGLEPSDNDGERALLPAPDRRREIRTKRSIAARFRLRQLHEPVFERAVRSALAREIPAARRALKSAFAGRDAQDFQGWIGKFYPEHHKRLVALFAPIVRAYGEVVVGAALEELGSDVTPEGLDAFAAEFTDELATREVNNSIAQLRAILRDTEAEEMEAALRDRLDTWEETRARKTARRESVLGGGAFAVFAFAAAGVTRLVWSTVGKSCPACLGLDGKIVEIHSTFAQPGDVLNPDGNGDRAPITVSRSFTHPPAHGGCDCVVVGG